MPRRNFFLILSVAVVSFACYQVTDHNPYGRYFADILSKVDRMYYKPVDREKLFDSAVTGMLGDLDEHSEFFSPHDASDFLALIDQHYGGVGIEVSVDPTTKRITVMSTIVGSPAYRADILTGDEILKIDGKSAVGLDVDKASDKIRGPIGTSVQLTLERAGHPAPLIRSLKRADVQVDSVMGDTRNANDSWNFHLAGHPEFGYIRIRSFGDRTAEEFKAALATLDRSRLKGLIVYLRFNGGGRLDAAIDVCSEFIPRGETIVTTKGRNGNVLSREVAIGPGTYTGFPMVVLVNSGSASASEIVAACLQDHHRAIICGHRSYGKGTVQRILPVEGNQSVLKLTTATYWRPSNKNIQRDKDAKDSDVWGVMPDPGFAVTLTKEEAEKMLKLRAESDIVHRAEVPPAAGGKPALAATPYVDPQLQRAIDYLEKSSGGK